MYQILKYVSKVKVKILLFQKLHFSLVTMDSSSLHLQQVIDTSEGKKNFSHNKGDIGMEVYYLCQPNTYVIVITAAHQIHKQ